MDMSGVSRRVAVCGLGGVGGGDGEGLVASAGPVARLSRFPWSRGRAWAALPVMHNTPSLPAPPLSAPVVAAACLLAADAAPTPDAALAAVAAARPGVAPTAADAELLQAYHKFRGIGDGA